MSIVPEQNGGKTVKAVKKCGCLGSLIVIAVIIVVLAVLVWYFCQHTTPLVISPETTYITEPLTADGYPDYFGAYERTWLPKLSPPEDNGQRDLVMACGPAALEQQELVNKVPWDEFPTNETSKEWYNDYYVPLCQAMSIDPVTEPKFLQSKDWFDAMLDQKKYQNETEAGEHFERLTKNPWKAEDEPETAAWLAERSPLLDIFGVAVRKPNFVAWRKRTNLLITVLIPDAQSDRRYVRDLQIRIAERIGRNDVDGAWYDIMSVLHFSRHYLTRTMAIEKAFSIATERIAAQSIKLLLQKGNPSKEQLAKFAADLDSLPNRWQSEYFNIEFERMCVYSILLHFTRDGVAELYELSEFLGNEPKKWMRLVLPRVPIDRDLCCRRISYYTSPLTETTADIKTLRKKAKECDRNIEQMRQSVKKINLFSLMFVRQRSEALADVILALSVMNNLMIFDAIFSGGAKFELARIAVALERYKKDENKYPDELQALVPKYLQAVPDDPFMWRPLKFSRNGEGYTLYSVGSNETDDSGNEKDDIVW